jgi:sulfate transport system permease protein
MKASSIEREPRWIKPALIAITLAFLAVFVFIPLATIFRDAFANGIKTYFAALKEPDVFAAIKLTLVTALICVPVNTVFGVLMAWAVTKFNFRFKHVLITMIEIPFAISPVIAGLLFIFLFGSFGWFGSWLIEHNLKIASGFNHGVMNLL